MRPPALLACVQVLTDPPSDDYCTATQTSLQPTLLRSPQPHLLSVDQPHNAPTQHHNRGYSAGVAHERHQHPAAQGNRQVSPTCQSQPLHTQALLQPERKNTRLTGRLHSATVEQKSTSDVHNQTNGTFLPASAASADVPSACAEQQHLMATPRLQQADGSTVHGVRAGLSFGQQVCPPALQAHTHTTCHHHATMSFNKTHGSPTTHTNTHLGAQYNGTRVRWQSLQAAAPHTTPRPPQPNTCQGAKHNALPPIKG